MDLKLEKEAFVSGLEGTTVGETYLLGLTLLAGYLLRCCSLVCIPSLLTLASSSNVVAFLLEYTTILLPAILIFTVLADYAAYVLLAESVTCVCLIAMSLKDATTEIFSSVKETLTSSYPLRRPYLTITRTFVNLFTAVAILAVDFSVFPRRLAKAETFGAGLMDVGVGLFLMAHGVTSPEARETTSTKQRSVGFLQLVGVTLKHVLPLLVLGSVRLLSVKSTGYQEHVTEYGVHWNFFFTIAAVRILCSLLHPLLVSLPYGHGIVAVVIAIAYQVLLQWGGVESYVLLGPHGDGSRGAGLLSANREGVVSCVGYLAIYAGWIEIGKWLFRPRRVLKDYFVLLVSLIPLFLSLWLCTIWLEEHVHPVSRRLVNLTYILWIFSYGFMVLSATLTIDLTVLILTGSTHKPRPPPYVHDHPSPEPLCAASAVDYNQLAFFVLANVLTGVVNFSVNTLHVGSAVALVVLALYMAVLLMVFSVLHKYRIKIKV